MAMLNNSSGIFYLTDKYFYFFAVINTDNDIFQLPIIFLLFFLYIYKINKLLILRGVLNEETIFTG
ncbi:MAG: hypothetical protein K5622_04300, partial [Endomicrobiaceae bacterium]|nr:hypothetical protein [Endomicrobiaceae bacterium]